MNTFFNRISITGIAAAGLGVAMLFGAGTASAATPEEPGFAALPCLTDFCPTIPDPDPDPNPHPGPLFQVGDLSTCIQHDEDGHPDCPKDTGPDPDPAVDAADDLMICTPWLHSLGICGNDGGDPPGSPTDDLAPAPHCVQIHKDFPCPGTDDGGDDAPEKDVPEILPFDGECPLILVELGTTPPVNPDCEDGICVHQLLEVGTVPEFVDPDCENEDSGPEIGDPPHKDTVDEDPQDTPAGEPSDTSSDEPQDQPQDGPGDSVDEQPLDHPSDTPADEPSDSPSDQPQAGDTPERVVPEAPDAGTGNAVAGMSPNTIYAALALAIAGGILGGAALSLGRKS